MLDQGWGLLKQRLDTKLPWSGGLLLLVDPAYTSQTCAVCGVRWGGRRKP
ncbi:MAG: zinc ribbon domain-containing protein [Acidiferrobacter sp.]